MSAKPFERRSARRGSSNSRSVTSSRKPATALSSIELLSFTLDQCIELHVLLGRHLRPALFPLVNVDRIDLHRLLLNDVSGVCRDLRSHYSRSGFRRYSAEQRVACSCQCIEGATDERTLGPRVLDQFEDRFVGWRLCCTGRVRSAHETPA